jgi:hypothetical protein
MTSLDHGPERPSLALRNPGATAAHSSSRTSAARPSRHSDRGRGGGFRSPCVSSTALGGPRDCRCLSCCYNLRLSGRRRQPRFVAEQVLAFSPSRPAWFDRLVELAQRAAEDRSHSLCGAVRQSASSLLWMIGAGGFTRRPPPGGSLGPVLNWCRSPSIQPAHANSRCASDCGCSASSVATAAMYASTSSWL